jgi:hypothetical protein
MNMPSPIIIYPSIIRHLYIAIISLMLLCSASTVMAAADRVGDDFLAGYVASILERDLLWERDSYILKIKNGVAKITLFEDDPARQEEANNKLRTIDGLQDVKIVVKSATIIDPDKVGSFMGISNDTETFPLGDLFQPLIADPKQPQFHASFEHFKSLETQYTKASVGFGETFGLYRYLGTREGDGLQLSLEAGIFGQFNLSKPSADLINADYTIGFPLTYRYGINSLRFRVYHQSSHLGDETLLGDNPPERINLSFEATELIYSVDWRGLRMYGGGEYLIHKEPTDLKPLSGHWGLEYQGDHPIFLKFRPIIGADMKSLEEHDWDIDTSIKAGFEFGYPNPGQRRMRIMAEWYSGYDPYGQFYNNKVEYYGLGVSLGF